MKTVLDIDDRLLARAKVAAAHERKSLTRLIEEGLILRLRKETETRAPSKVKLPVFEGGSGLAPGVDPLSNQSLYEAANS